MANSHHPPPRRARRVVLRRPTGGTQSACGTWSSHDHRVFLHSRRRCNRDLKLRRRGRVSTNRANSAAAFFLLLGAR
jgi:hypothetical protein